MYPVNALGSLRSASRNRVRPAPRARVRPIDTMTFVADLIVCPDRDPKNSFPPI